jgi:hybrid cluster-associated redox disulfide protein
MEAVVMGRAKREARPSVREFRADELIGDLLDRDPRVQEVLSGFGLPCDRCVVKDFETLAEGCAPLGLKVGEVLARLNALEQA